MLCDFRQILPVIKGGNRAEIVSSSIKSSNLWKLFTAFELQENVRLSGAVDTKAADIYDKWLLDVGNGIAEKPASGSVDSVLLSDSQVFLIDSQCRRVSLNHAIHWVFGDTLKVKLRYELL